MVGIIRAMVTFCLLGALLALKAAAAPSPAASDRWPRFSPDGTRIAFASNRDGGGIYVMDSDGTDLRKVPLKTTAGTSSFGPSWLSNTTLLFSGARPTLASGEDNGLEATEFVVSSTTGQSQRIVYQGINQERPDASPSGTTLVFEAEHGPYQTDPNIDLYKLEIASLDLRVLTHNDGQYGQAAWSPDGSRIAYTCTHGGAAPLQICVMNKDGTNVVEVTKGEGSHQWPTWSPDSKQIAFFLESKLGGKTDSNILIINSDGAGQHAITHHDRAQRDETPCWSPNGKLIAFQTDRQGSGFRIAVMDADGGHVTMLTR